MSETNKVMSSIQFPNTEQPYQVEDRRIPANPGAYQQLVTNGAGEWGAADRLAYETTKWMQSPHGGTYYASASYKPNSSYADCYATGISVSPYAPQIGDALRISIDDREYEGILQEYTYPSGYGYDVTSVGFGNLSIYINGAEDTGEEVFVRLTNNNQDVDIYFKEGTFPVEIVLHAYVGEVEIKPIDPKFLLGEVLKPNQYIATDADGKLVQEDKPFGEEVVRAELATGWGDSLSVSKGDKIVVVYLNTEYELTVKKADGSYYSSASPDATGTLLYVGNTAFAAELFSETMYGTPITEQPSDDVPFFVGYWDDSQGSVHLVLCDADNMDGRSGADWDVYRFATTIKTLSEKFLPKAEAVADAAGETPTAAEFNALLTALRNAGYLNT